MNYKHYIAEGSEAVKAREAANIKFDALSTKLSALFENFPRSEYRNEMVTESPFGGFDVYGVAYKIEHGLSEQEQKGFGVKESKKTLAGNVIYVPNNRTKAGKDLLVKMSTLSRKLRTFRQLLIDELGVNADVFQTNNQGRTGIFRTSSWEPEDKDKFYIKIPYNEEYPLKPVPAWFREPEGDEWKHFVN